MIREKSMNSRSFPLPSQNILQSSQVIHRWMPIRKWLVFCKHAPYCNKQWTLIQLTFFEITHTIIHIATGVNQISNAIAVQSKHQPLQQYSTGLLGLPHCVHYWKALQSNYTVPRLIVGNVLEAPEFRTLCYKQQNCWFSTVHS